MRNVKEHINITKLIAKEFAGACAKEEKEELDEWQKESKNQIIYQRILDSIMQEKHYSEFKNVDIDSGWVEFEGRIKKQSKTRRLKKYFYYAAAAVILAVIIPLANNFYSNSTVEPVSSQAMLEPGTQKATLYLSDGRAVNLEGESIEEIIDVSGTVVKNENEVLKYDKEEIKIPDELKYHTLAIPRGGEYKLILADGSKVWLNSLTKLRYPVTFGKNNRELFLEEGEAYFEVEEDMEKTFIINTSGYRINVTGTAFNVKAYAMEEEVATTLVEGSVSITSKKFNKSYLLEPGLQLKLNTESGAVSIDRVETELYTGWKDGRFIFVNQSLEEIITTMSRWYEFDVFYSNESSKKLKFTGNLGRYESVNIFLEKLGKTDKIWFEIKDKQVIVWEK